MTALYFDPRIPINFAVFANASNLRSFLWVTISCIEVIHHPCSLATSGKWNPSWWRHQVETFSALLALCAGNSPVTGEFPSQRPVIRSFDVFIDLLMNNAWVNNRQAVDLRRYRAHYDVIVMILKWPLMSPLAWPTLHNSDKVVQYGSIITLWNLPTIPTIENPYFFSFWVVGGWGVQCPNYVLASLLASLLFDIKRHISQNVVV